MQKIDQKIRLGARAKMTVDGIEVTYGYDRNRNLATTDAVSLGTPHAGNAVKRAALAGAWGE